MELLREPRWERRKESRPGELLAAALQEFVQHGYAATRLEDIAAAAGVSKATLYQYFPGKEELFRQVILSYIVPEIAQQEQMNKSFQGSTTDLLRNFFHDWHASVRDNRYGNLGRLLIAEAEHFPELMSFYYDEVISRVQNMLVAMLERGIARGEFRRINMQQAIHALTAPFIVLSAFTHQPFQHLRPQLALDDYLNSVLDVLFNGLLINPDHRPIPTETS